MGKSDCPTSIQENHEGESVRLKARAERGPEAALRVAFVVDRCEPCTASDGHLFDYPTLGWIIGTANAARPPTPSASRHLGGDDFASVRLFGLLGLPRLGFPSGLSWPKAPTKHAVAGFPPSGTCPKTPPETDPKNPHIINGAAAVDRRVQNHLIKSRSGENPIHVVLQQAPVLLAVVAHDPHRASPQ